MIGTFYGFLFWGFAETTVISNKDDGTYLKLQVSIDVLQCMRVIILCVDLANIACENE